MSVRAYKIAEELGIERNEFVEKARTLGVELKNAMAPLEDEQIAFLREKLTLKRGDVVTEARVERKGGTAVIRRRKRVAEPEPEPVAVPPSVELVESEPVAPPPEPALESESALPPPLAVAPEPEAPPAHAAAAAGPAAVETPREAAPRSRPAPRDDALGDRAGHSRKQFKEVVNLRE